MEAEEASGCFKMTETDPENIEILRPLEIGYERLPEGVFAQDFVEYLPVLSVKPQKYKNGELPFHPIFGEHAVISREVMEIQFEQHTEFYRNIVENKLGKKVIRIGEKRPDDKFIPWHLVEESEHDSSFSEFKKTRPAVKKEVSECNSSFSKILSEESRSLIKGLDKLLTKIDYLKFYSTDEENSESEESD